MELDRCSDLRPHFAAFVSATASSSVEHRIQLHLSNVCASCATELEQLHDAFHAVALVRPVCGLDSDQVNALVDAVARLPQEAVEVPIVFSETPERRLAWLLVCLFAVAVGAAGFWGVGQLDARDRLTQSLELEQRQLRSTVGDYRDLQVRAERLAERFESYVDPRTHVADLSGDGFALRVAFESSAGRMSVSTSGLLPGGGGRDYVLWAAGDAAWVPLGIVEPSRENAPGVAVFAVSRRELDPAELRLTLQRTEGGALPAQPGEVVPISLAARGRLTGF